jgi:hypothetical protein
MRILVAEINMYEGFANDPTFKLTVDEMPESEDFVYTKKELDGCTLYFAEHESGLVRFFCHAPANEGGYGGHEFNLKMDDGSTETIKGPWSSRCGQMNHYFTHSVEATINGVSGAITAELAKKAAEMAGVQLIFEKRRDDLIYRIPKDV